MLTIYDGSRAIFRWQVDAPFMKRSVVVEAHKKMTAVHVDDEELKYLISEGFSFDPGRFSHTYTGQNIQLVVGFLCGKFSTE